VPPADHRQTYGSTPLEFGELRLPKTPGPHPVAVLIHGGCWVDRLPGRDPRITGFEPLRPFAAALTAAGVATWNIEYRRAGHRGGGWPGSFQDIGRATDYLRRIAPKHGLDLARIVVVGHSAGGQLALWIAARPKLPADSPVHTNDALPVKAVVDIDGPPDLESAFPEQERFCPVPGITRFLGGTPADHQRRYREGSAAAWLPLGVPQTIFVGGLLADVPDLASGYQARAAAKGDAVTVVTLPGSGHFDMLQPGTPHPTTVQRHILTMLER
jgi:acetyl esterase/lipase